jgi:putative salt-induced outer membrane protein YdiY
MEGERIEVRIEGTPAVTTDRASVLLLRSEEEQKAFERVQSPGLLELWRGAANLGLALTSGNSDTTNIAFGLALERATLRDKTSLYAAALYARDSTEEESRTTANALRGGMRYDRDISRKWFGYGFTDLESNKLQDLNLRLVFGGGLGYHAIRSERAELDILGGVDWNKEYFEGDLNDRSSAELQLGQTLSWRLGSRAALKEQFFVFPNLSEGGKYRLNFDTTLATDITRWIGWQLTLSDRYLSNPPEGLKKNDLLLTTGLSFKIGRSGK